MDESTANLASAIGARVKQERQSRRWTLDQLAEAAGVSRRMVVNVEQGAANPSVGTLLRLSDALGVGLPALVEPPEPKSVKVTRRVRAPRCGPVRAVGGECWWPAPTPPDVVELWDWTLGPGDQHMQRGPRRRAPRNSCRSRRARSRVEVADQSVTLDAGDAVAFPGDVAHSYANPGTAAGEVLPGRLRARRRGASTAVGGRP